MPIASRHLVVWLALVLIASALALGGGAGCASEPDLKRTLYLYTGESANSGKPFYVVVRAVAEADFLAESYRDIGAKIVPDAEDTSVRAVSFTQPGRDQKLVVEMEEEAFLAVYAMYTNPGEPWKVLIAPPLGRKYAIQLDSNTIRQLDRPKKNSDSRNGGRPGVHEK